MRSTLRGLRGFTLVEMMIVIAIIVVLIALIAPVAADAHCTASRRSATAAVTSCSTLMANADASDLQDVLNCLRKAQTAIDDIEKEQWWGDTGKATMAATVAKVNQEIDNYKTKVETEEDRESLEEAKLEVP